MSYVLQIFPITILTSKGFEAVSNVWAHQYLNQHHSAHLHADLRLKTLQAHYTDIIGIFGYGAIGYPSENGINKIVKDQ